jgi:hypothetical protein
MTKLLVMGRFVCALAFVAMQACLHAQPASIEGVAIDSVTRQPLAGVHIKLGPLPGDAIYGAISGRDGHFSITSMPPYVYIVDAERYGYLHLPSKDSKVTLKPGDRVTGLTVEMTPEAVIIGHVVDEFGDPVQYVEVRASPGSGASEPSGPISRTGRTDDRGQFRIVLPPGKFYLQTIANRGGGQGDSPVYGATFYPGAATKDRATAVELAAGQQVTGIDIALARSRTATISGMVTGLQANAERFEYTQIELHSAEESPEQPSPPRLIQARQDGSFAIAGLTPGRYRIQAGSLPPGPDGGLRSAAVEVQLGSADETGIRLALVAGEPVSGTVEIEGDAGHAGPAAGKMTVRLEPEHPVGFFGRGNAAETGDDGTFRIEQVFPEKHRVSVLPLPENAYIKSVSLGGAEAPDGIVDFSRGVGGANIKVTISRNGGQMEGTVMGEDGQPLLGTLAVVVLAATADEIREDTVKEVGAGKKFKFMGLRPGKYRLFAVDALREFGAGRNEEALLKSLFANAPEIEIHEGDRIDKDIKVLSLEGADAK